MTIVASNSLTVSNISDGTITHTAYSKSVDGTDGFTTIYPNLNFLDDGKFAKPISSKWNTDGTTISKDSITGYFKVIFNGTGSYNRAYYTASVSTIPIGQKYSVYIKAYSLEDSLNIKLGTVNTSQAVTVTKNGNIPKIYKVEGLVRGTSNTLGIFGGLITTLGTLFISEIKVEPGSKTTLYMPSASEATTTDWPKYRGEYSDTSSEQSTNPSNYTWSVMRGNDGKNGADGIDGIAGKDGVGVETTTITYAISTSGTTAPTTWATTIPSVADGSYLWNRYVWTYTDNTSETGYSVAKMGDTGPKGDTGAKGETGSKGDAGTNGVDAITVLLSNENVTLPANALGGVLSYDNSGTVITVMRGAVKLTPSGSTPTSNDTFSVVSSLSGIAMGSKTINVDNKSIDYGNISSMSSVSGASGRANYSITYRVNGTNTTIVKVQNFTKAEKGITGDKGIDSYTYIRYSASSNGASMTSLPNADSQYIGTCTTTQATAPTTAGSYVWAKFVGANGVKGDPTGITRSTTEPSTSYTGMLWQYTGTVNLVVTGITALPSSLYVWTGSAWQLYLVKSTNLQVDNGFITNAMIGDATIESAKIKSMEAKKILADSLDVISGNLGTMTAGIIKIIADIVINAANKTKKFGMLFTKKGLLSSGPSYKADNTVSDTKMAVASLTQGELRFMNMDYNENLEQVQDSGTSSANNGFIRFSSTAEKGDLLEITSSKILLNGLTTQTSPWIEASSFAKYRVAFGTVTVSVGVINGGSSANIYLGHMPDELRPLDSRMLYAPAWYADNSRDRHFQIDRDNGNMGIVNPFPGQEYRFEVVWSIPY